MRAQLTASFRKTNEDEAFCRVATILATRTWWGRFVRFGGAGFVRGMVPDTLSQVTATAICYLSLDMNNTAPEIAAAEHFWDRLVPGGIIVLDDYGWRKQINQNIAFDRFAGSQEG